MLLEPTSIGMTDFTINSNIGMTDFTINSILLSPKRRARSFAFSLGRPFKSSSIAVAGRSGGPAAARCARCACSATTSNLLYCCTTCVDIVVLFLFILLFIVVVFCPTTPTFYRYCIACAKLLEPTKALLTFAVF